MKVIESVLYMEFSEMVEVGVSQNTLFKAVQRNSWTFIKDPSDKRRVLFEYERLKEDYKDKVKAKFGNPYEYVCREPIRQLVKWDNKAEQWFFDYKYGENNEHTLKPETQKKYTIACNWLNMLVEVNADKKLLKKTLKLTMDEFYDHVIAMLKLEQVDLPMSYRRLLAKVSDFKDRGYRCMIDPRFGNQNSAKVNDENSEALLMKMIEDPLQWDDVFIAELYNKWVAQQNEMAGKRVYKPITSATVGVHRRKKEAEISMGRNGSLTKMGFNEKWLPEVKGERPSKPLLFVESDDNHLDLYFMSVDANGKYPYYQNRYVSVVVTDSYNDLVLGYAYTMGEVTHELVRAAYLNAMYYIKSLTGAWYMPHEVKTDKFALKELRPFYESMGNYVDAALGNKHRGYIEQFFGSAHWKRCLKMGANNYSGNNITAKNRGVNTEWLKANEKNYPMIGNEAEGQIEAFFTRLRTFAMAGEKSKEQAWLEAWHEVAEADKKQISEQLFLYKFGIPHVPKNGSKNRISNRGMEAQINGVEYSYDLETEDLQRYIGKEVTIYYDPYDMSRVLLTDNDKVRIIARDARLHSRALGDAKEGSRAFLNVSLERKREMSKKMGDKSAEREAILNRKGVHLQDLILDISTPKELKMEAERRYLSSEFSVQRSEFTIDESRDFDLNRDVYGQM